MTKKTAILAAFILLKFFLQYILISPEYDLQRDEYLHLDQANHLAWGYLSVPPVTSWISFIISAFGNSIFWIKFFPALFGVLTMVVVWKTIDELNGSLFALILGASCVLFSALLRVNTLYQPNSLDILCWTTLYYIIFKYLNTDQPKWLFIGAVVFALGFLNKYNIAFLLLGFFPALLMTRQRKLLIDRQLYLALGLGFLLVVPNVYWQYTNQFPVIHHMKELAETQLVHVDRLGFLRSQLLFFIGALLVIISALYALMFYKPFEKYRPFFWSILFTIVVFLYFKAKDYYAIGVYPIYIAFGSVYLGEILKSGWKRYLQPVLIAIPIFFFIVTYNLVYPNKTPEYIEEHAEKYRALGMLRWEDGKDHEIPQDFSDMLGWKELAEKVDKVYATVPNPEQTIVLCDNYGQAGAINFYSTKRVQAVSFNADYVNWFDLEKNYVNVIRVIEYSERDEEFKETSKHFQTSSMVDSVANKYAREYGTTIYTFLNAKVDINALLKTEIEEVKTYK